MLKEIKKSRQESEKDWRWYKFWKDKHGIVGTETLSDLVEKILPRDSNRVMMEAYERLYAMAETDEEAAKIAEDPIERPKWVKIIAANLIEEIR